MVNALMAVVMFTVGIGMHIAMWAILLEYINKGKSSDPIYWPSTILGFFVMCIGSFLILTSIIIVLRIATGVAI